MLKNQRVNTEINAQNEEQYESYADRFRYALAGQHAYFPLVILGFFAGVSTALVICSFLLGIELVEQLFLSGISDRDPIDPSGFLQGVMNNSDSDFEKARALPRFLLVVGGALLLGAIYQLAPTRYHSTGLNHTLITLHQKDGKFSTGNFILQFFGGILALGSGQSGGREGPGIHLGAGSSTILAQRAYLPDNSLRLLTACGAASAIAAAFNTPIAGVIFALEVILMDYTLRSFVPVIIAATISTIISQLLFGNQPMFGVAEMQLASLSEIPVLFAIGACCAFAAVGFMTIQRLASPLQNLPVTIRFGLVGLITATIGIAFPQILGVGFDSIHGLLNGSMAAGLLFAICLLKIVSTSLGSAVGMPIGIVGPSLFIGATLGAAIGQYASIWYPGGSSAQFYALLAMGGVMSALLNAPLAAVIAVMELSRTTGALLPGIFVVVVANLMASRVFRQRSANQILLERNGVEFESRPISQALSRYSLASIVNVNTQLIQSEITIAKVLDEKSRPASCVVAITDVKTIQRLVKEHDVAEHVKEKTIYILIRPDIAKRVVNEVLLDSPDNTMITSSQIIDRTSKNNRQLLRAADMSWTVEHARRELADTAWMDGLYVSDHSGPKQGVVTRADLDQILKNW